ncbi:hypothetical protein LL962_20790 [Xanthomonas sp. NCPPB 1067]|nr:hypothetical protein [Xanthomonas sp. NCPPB 1067]
MHASLEGHQRTQSCSATTAGKDDMRRTLVMLFAAIAIVSLGGCVTKPYATPNLVEGPVGLGETAAVDGPKVRPDQVIEDSRCPADVQCIQAGRLIVRATVIGGG